VAERLMQDRWTGPRGRGHSRVLIVAEHVGLKPRINTDKDAAEDGAEKAAEDAKAVNQEPENTPELPVSRQETGAVCWRHMATAQASTRLPARFWSYRTASPIGSALMLPRGTPSGPPAVCPAAPPPRGQGQSSPKCIAALLTFPLYSLKYICDLWDVEPS
jgi:hypothetical protein